MDPWQATLLVVVALLAGALLPVAVQLTLTLPAVRAAAVRADRSLAAVSAAAEKVNGLLGRLEAGGRIDSLVEGIDSLSRTVTRLQESLRIASAVGAAVGPAVGAAVRAWRAPREGGAPPDGGDVAIPESQH